MVDRQDLRQWRERFAERLRAHGVDANATPRRTRGVTRRYPKQGVAHMLARGEAPKYWHAVANAEQQQVEWQSRSGVLAAWREIARAMAASLARPDREMAVGIADFVRTMPVLRDEPTVSDRRQQKAPPQPERMQPEQGNRPDDPGPEVDR
jgi:hypothetical protein